MPAASTFACLQRRVEEYQQQYVEAAWGSLLALLRQDARQPLPPNLAVDRAARQAVKDKWTAANKVLAEAQAQQVGGGGLAGGGLAARRRAGWLAGWLASGVMSGRAAGSQLLPPRVRSTAAGLGCARRRPAARDS